jgi:drug/metabolite transporter (DMT)-like permease
MGWELIALTSAFFSAVAAVLEKKILFKEKAFTMSFILALFNFVLAVPFFFFVDYSLVTSSALMVLFFKSILGAAAYLLVLMGMRRLEISQALPLLVLTPGLVALFAFLLLGESLVAMEIGGMILLLVGTYLLQVGGKKGFFSPVKSFVKSKGNYYILGALVLFTITSLLDKALLKNFNVPVNAFMGFQHLFFAIIFGFVAIFYVGERKEFVRAIRFSGWAILALAVVTVIYRYTQIYATNIAPVALVLAMKRISVFFAVLIGGKLFRDSNLFVRIIATALMVGGAVMIIVS